MEMICVLLKKIRYGRQFNMTGKRKKEITPPHLPFSLDEKVFQVYDEDGEPIGQPHSYNDFIKQINNISGVNPDLLGYKNDR